MSTPKKNEKQIKKIKEEKGGIVVYTLYFTSAASAITFWFFLWAWFGNFFLEHQVLIYLEFSIE